MRINSSSLSTKADQGHWETQLTNAFEPLTRNGVALNDQVVTDIRLAGTAATSLDTCGRSDADLNVLTEKAFYDLWAGNGNRSYRLAELDGGPSSNPNGFEESDAAPPSTNGVLSRLSAPTSDRRAVSFPRYTPPPANAQASRGIPCAMTAPQFMFSTIAGSATVASFTEDRCVRAASEYACEVETLNTPVSYSVALTAVWLSTLPGCSFGSCSESGTLPMQVTRVCRLPRYAKGCVEAAHCATPSGAARANFNARGFQVADAGASTNDARCGQTLRTGGIEFDLNNDRALADSQRLGSEALFAQCASALAPNVTTVTAKNGAGFAQLIDSANRCLDARRLGLTLSLASGAAFAGDGADPKREAFFAWQVQRLLQLKTAFSRNVLESERLADAIRTNSISGRPVPVSLRDALATSLAAWAWLELPRVASGLDMLPGSSLRMDYRTAANAGFAVRPATDQQANGLPATMLEALAADVLVAVELIEKARLSNDVAQLVNAQQAFRVATYVLPMARGLFARADADARQNNQTLAWRSRFASAESSTAIALQRLARASNALRSGANPLGIEESDLPLYYLTNSTAPSARFSAVSDYLLGSPQMRGWAPTLVTQADTALIEARTAWVAQQDRKLAQELLTSAGADRLQALKESYGEKILAQCGSIPGITAANALDSNVNPKTCYLRTEQPACQFDEAAYLRLLTADDVRYQYCLASSLKRFSGNTIRMADPLTEEIASSTCTSLDTFSEPCTEPGAGGTCFRMRCTRASGQPLVARLRPGSLSSVITIGPQPDAPRLLAESLCQRQYPQARTSLPSFADSQRTTLDNGACYRGSLGERALAIRALGREADIAKAEFDEHGEAYTIHLRSCDKLRDANASAIALNAATNVALQALETAKFAADTANATVSAAIDCAQSASGDFWGGPSICGCGFAAGKAGLTLVSG